MQLFLHIFCVLLNPPPRFRVNSVQFIIHSKVCQQIFFLFSILNISKQGSFRGRVCLLVLKNTSFKGQFEWLVLYLFQHLKPVQDQKVEKKEVAMYSAKVFVWKPGYLGLAFGVWGGLLCFWFSLLCVFVCVGGRFQIALSA